MSASAERALVGLILHDATALDAATNYGITADAFTDQDTRDVFAAIQEAEANMRPFDVMSLSATMGVEYAFKLVSLEQEGPIAQNANYFAAEVAAAYWTRRMGDRLARAYTAFLKREPFATIEPLKVLLSGLVEEAMDLSDRIPETSTVVERSLASLEERVTAVREGRKVGLGSGFQQLDRLLGGFLPGGMYVLAARKKVGKTTFAINIALSAAQVGAPVAFFTVEMRDQEIMDQAIIRMSGVRADHYVHGRLSDDDVDKVATSAGQLAKIPLYVREVRDPSAEHLFHDIRRLWRTRGIRFVVIDYTQQFRYTGQRFGSRQQEMTLLTSQIKSLATELQISVLAIAQLNRAAEDSVEPTSSHIKDSGSFEQDADAVMLLWTEAEGVHIVNVADNRRGSPGRFVLRSDLSRKLFWE